MALVNYSDSEASDAEDTAPAPQPPLAAPALPKSSNTSSSKSTFSKSVNPAQPRKIKLDLPSIQPEPTADGSQDEPPAKKARTAGAFSGFNSLLPAPRRTAAQNAPKAGVSLKTSNEAAFSRNPLPKVDDVVDEGEDAGVANESGRDNGEKLGSTLEAATEVKVVGKATKFKPLSVGSKKKPVVKKAKIEEGGVEGPHHTAESTSAVTKQQTVVEDVAPPPPKPKRSLFSVPQREDEADRNGETASNTYESITTPSNIPLDSEPNNKANHTSPPQLQQQANNPNSLATLTTDLNLTPAQRRQLFGRHANSTTSNINLTHFDMEHEYAANEQLRQAGEVVEHRAVKAIAPGKHSLQQLVNNARSQQESLEDKWAAGRRERGEAGKGYGWGR